MNQYHKINSIFKRNMDGDKKLIVGDWSTPEFEFFANCPWVFTEKFDGTNIRVLVDPSVPAEENLNPSIRYKGKSDNASIPGPLTAALHARFDTLAEKLHAAFPFGACLYGEGYGGKIQSGSKTFGPDQRFVLFDIMVGDCWLEREAIEGIAGAYGIDIVPIIGHGTLMDAVNLAKAGIKSTRGDFLAEGIVARPKIELCDKRGGRIIAKIKCRDFDAEPIRRL